MTEQEYLSKNPKAVQKKQATTPAPSAPVNIQRMEAGDLQRLVGNRQAQRMLAQRQPERSKPPLFIQTKLTVGAANDAYEQEADSVANQVMTARDPAGAAPAAGNVQRAEEDEMIGPKRIQREEAPEDESEGAAMRIQRQEAPEMEDEEGGAMRIQRQAQEDEPLMAKRMLMADRIQRDHEGDEMEDEGAAMRIQRVESPEMEDEEGGAMRIQRQEAPEMEDEEGGAMRIQRKDDNVDMMGSFDVGAGVEKAIDSSRGGGQAMSDEHRGFFEDRMGYDFSNVNIHNDSNSAGINREIQAQAFTTGNDIYFNSDKYNPGSDDGKRLLAHELTHVVQQGGAAPKAQADREDKK